MIIDVPLKPLSVSNQYSFAFYQPHIHRRQVSERGSIDHLGGGLAVLYICAYAVSPPGSPAVLCVHLFNPPSPTIAIPITEASAVHWCQSYTITTLPWLAETDQILRLHTSFITRHHG